MEDSLVQALREQSWRELSSIAEVIASMPSDTPQLAQTPLLGEQIRIAMHGVDRLLCAIAGLPVAPSVAQACLLQTQRVIAAATVLRSAVSAIRHPSAATPYPGVEAAVANLNAAVDELHAVVTGTTVDAQNDAGGAPLA